VFLSVSCALSEPHNEKTNEARRLQRASGSASIQRPAALPFGSRGCYSWPTYNVRSRMSLRLALMAPVLPAGARAAHGFIARLGLFVLGLCLQEHRDRRQRPRTGQLGDASCGSYGHCIEGSQNSFGMSKGLDHAVREMTAYPVCSLKNMRLSRPRPAVRAAVLVLAARRRGEYRRHLCPRWTHD
jgi:hypothetical protein